MQWNDGADSYGLTQETKYPFDNKIQIQVSGSQAKDYTIYVRIPGWATPNPVLSVNGKRVSDAVQPGTFASIRRTWKDGDRVELELPMPLAAGDGRCESSEAGGVGARAARAVRGGRFAAQLRSATHCCKPRPRTIAPEIGSPLQPTAAA